MASQKRGGSFNHYGDRSQPFNKKPRPNQPTYNSASYDDRNRNGHGKNAQQQYGDDAIPPQPELSSAEMQTGLTALLDRFLQAETAPDADKDTLYHARELRRLLCSRKDTASARAKRELDERRPDRVAHVIIPDYVYRKVQEAKELPPLPPITEPHLHDAVFTHHSLHLTNANVHQTIDLGLDYERLEFLGDAYIELIASRALYNRFPQVDIPQLSSWRERLVENSALGKFSEAYGFPDRLKYGKNPQWDKNSKAWKKVVADIFEAYVAGIVLSDPENGFNAAERWLDELWAPQLLNFKEKIIENPRARDDLQKLIFVNKIEIKYREERAMTITNGVQNYYLGVYLTGWGYTDEWLGSGEGQNKAQAAISAATDALKRNNEVLQDATRQKAALMEVKAKEREDKARAEAAADEQGEEHPAAPSNTVEDIEKHVIKRKSETKDASPEKTSKKHKKDKKEKRERKHTASAEGDSN
jgi:ribonuclease-3